MIKTVTLKQISKGLSFGRSTSKNDFPMNDDKAVSYIHFTISEVRGSHVWF